MSTIILVEKSKRMLTVDTDGRVILRVRIALGSQPVGPKRREGDGKTPEGEYTVCTRNAQSKYHLSLGLSYLNQSDAADAFSARLITTFERDAICSAADQKRRPPWDTALGGFIMIHGGGAANDWTAGCIALDDRDMDALWPLCPVGTRVFIRP